MEEPVVVDAPKKSNKTLIIVLVVVVVLCCCCAALIGGLWNFGDQIFSGLGIPGLENFNPQNFQNF